MTNLVEKVKLPVIYDAVCAEYHRAGHPERPQRVLSSYEKLRTQKEFEVEWLVPTLAPDETLLLAHSREHIERLRMSTGDFDADTPAYARIDDHARLSAGAAVLALETALKNGTAFSMMRPPGHHATPNEAMGFCYLSNASIAALLGRSKVFNQVALFDFDVHHGNGTEAVIKDCANIIFASTHQSPCYPGTGLQDTGTNCFNYPIPPQTPPSEYRKFISSAVNRLKSHNPDLLVVSAGFDAYKGDPIAQERLELLDFFWIGQMVKSFNIPTVHLLEGGYSDDLCHLIHAYFLGFLGCPTPAEFHEN